MGFFRNLLFNKNLLKDLYFLFDDSSTILFDDGSEVLIKASSSLSILDKGKLDLFKLK